MGRYFFAAPTREQVERIYWNDVKAFIPKDWILKISESDLSIDTKFGSRLELIGLDKPQRLEGVDYHGGIIDESADVKPGVWGQNIYPTLARVDGWAWRIGVPKRDGCGSKEFQEVFELGKNFPNKENTQSFTWTSDVIFTKEQIDYARDNLDPADFREQFQASWETVGGRIFYNFSKDNITTCEYNPNLQLFVTSDFNVNPMSWLICQRIGDVIYVIDEIFIRNTNTLQTLNELYNRYSNHTSGFFFTGDSAANNRNTSASESDVAHITNDIRFKQMGRKVVYDSSHPLIKDRFAATNARLRLANGNVKLFVDPKCKHLIDDLNYRHYKQGTTIVDDDIKDAGHMTDALGYLVYKLYPVNKIIETMVSTIDFSE